MKKRIIYFFVKKLSALLQYSQQYELEKIKGLPNVFISDRLILGKSSEIILNGICKEISIRDDVYLKHYCQFLLHTNASLIINEGVFFNNFCSIICGEKIEIGKDTMFGENVKIYDHNHDYEIGPMLTIHKDRFTKAPVFIGKNCWIGSNVTILKGVTIGDNVIIGANCLIYKSIPSNSIVKINQSQTITVMAR